MNQIIFDSLFFEVAKHFKTDDELNSPAVTCGSALVFTDGPFFRKLVEALWRFYNSVSVLARVVQPLYVGLKKSNHLNLFGYNWKMDIGGSFPKCKASFIASSMNKKTLPFFAFLAILTHKNYHRIEKLSWYMYQDIILKIINLKQFGV